VGKKGTVYVILMRKHEGKRLLERPGDRRYDEIKKDLKEIYWEDMDSINLVGNRYKWRAVTNAVMNL
jgi:hypothetical protein